MRYLTIVRHAKAGAPAPGESDFDRPLSGRGRRQCEELRHWANDARSLGAFGPTTALVSSAARTRETYRRAFEGTAFVSSVIFSDLIYNGRHDVTGEDLVSELAGIDPVSSSLLVVAHNPSVHELVDQLATEVPEILRHDGYPLGGAFVVELPDDQHIGLSRYRVVARYVPRGAA